MGTSVPSTSTCQKVQPLQAGACCTWAPSRWIEPEASPVDRLVLVHEQQEDIDKIEEQVGESHTSAAAGLKEVKQAADMQSTCVLQ